MLQDRLTAVGGERTLVAQPTNGKPTYRSGTEGRRLSKDDPSPSTNGANGDKARSAQPSSPGDRGGETPAKQSPAPAAGRGPDGRFAKRNAGGTGNPFARQVAALRQAALAVLNP